MKSVPSIVAILAGLSITCGRGAWGESFLPLEDPLNVWLYRMEAAEGEALVGVHPFFAADLPGSSTPGLEGPASLLELRAAGYGRTLYRNDQAASPGEGILLMTGGMATAEALRLDGDFETRAGGTWGLNGRLLPSLGLYERMSIWVASDETAPSGLSPFHLGEEEGRHLYVDWAFVDWSYRWFRASFGRLPQRWGPGRFTQLLISGNSPAMDMLQIRYGLGEMSSFTGLTGSIESDSAIYLTAHRLELFPRGNLRVGLSEAVLFRSDGLELAYLNPFIPWYPVQWNERDDDNVLLCFDATWVPLRGLAAYGEFLVDDFHYQKKNNRPHKLGFSVGLDSWLDGAGVGAVLEYTRISRYVYSQRRECNFYLHDDRIIGSELGPDCDRVTMAISSTVAWPVVAELLVDHTRHGEGTVYEGWPDSAQAGEPFPSGTIEYTTGAGLDLSLYLGHALEAHGSVRNEWLRNAGNQQGATDERLDTSLRLLYRF